MKQTAVEWLYDQIENKGKCIYEVIDQARAMEKEQIMNAFGEGIISAFCSSKMNGNEYYKETFKSE